MDDLLELLFEFVFEVGGDLVMGSRRVKTWIKTTLFAIFGGVITAVLGIVTWNCWDPQDLTAGIVMAAVTALLLFLTVFGAIKGHKRKWISWT